MIGKLFSTTTARLGLNVRTLRKAPLVTTFYRPPKVVPPSPQLTLW